MLGAEQLALKSRTVHQLAAVKERELEHMLVRFEAIGNQAGLVCLLASTNLCSVDPVANLGYSTISYLFFISSMIGCKCLRSLGKCGRNALGLSCSNKAFCPALMMFSIEWLSSQDRNIVLRDK